MSNKAKEKPPIASRFRGYLPVVIDVETGGLNPQTDALLEIAAVLLRMGEDGKLLRHKTYFHHIKPFDGANLDPKALEVNGIDPFHPFRFAIPEEEALQAIFQMIRAEVKAFKCTRAVLVGHNPVFDMDFLRMAVARCQIKHNPFHAFTTFDTATLGGVAYGQTVLAKAYEKAGFEFNKHEAHSAIYDAECTADLFCKIVNEWPTKFDT